MPNEFNHKICRSCGQSFHGDANLCDSCLQEFSALEEKFKASEHSKYLSHCKYCGRPFLKMVEVTRINKKTGQPYTFIQETRKEYCTGKNGDYIHYGQCQHCGGPVADPGIKSGNWPSKAGCSRECTQAVKEPKKRATSLKRYGTEVPSQSRIIREKMEQTSLERYGVKSYLQRGATREIVDAKMREKYGVESNISQNPEIRAKITATVEEKHGGYTWASPTLSEKCKETSRKMYGTEYPTQSEIIKERRVQTNLAALGVSNVMQDPEIAKRQSKSAQLSYAKTIKDDHHRQNYLDFCEDPVSFILHGFDHKPTLSELSQSMGGFDTSTICFRLGSDNYNRLVDRSKSEIEQEVEAFLLDLFQGDVTIHLHDRTIIKEDIPRRNKEIDIYLPDYNFGIECNPTYTHNSSVPAFSSDNDIMDKSFHLYKTQRCEAAGCMLFHIFGYEWTHKKEIIKSMIANLLGRTAYKYYARNLHVENLSFNECKQFLINNHRQGNMNATVRLGLKTNDGVLVSVMTFNSVRHTIGGSKNVDSRNWWELSRFCNLINTSVVGGASKLFKYFISHYQYDGIISFSDRAHTSGKLYQILEFEKKHYSEPNYIWVKNDGSDVVRTRNACQKRNLPSIFNEPDLDIVNQTEAQIMVSHGFVQVFDSGTIRWEYTKR